MGLLLGDRGAVWLTVGLCEVLIAELQGRPCPDICRSLRESVANADLATQFHLLLSLDDLGVFNSGPWRDLAVAAVCMLWQSRPDFVGALAAQAERIQSSVVDGGSSRAFREDCGEYIGEVLQECGLPVGEFADLLSAWVEEDCPTGKQLRASEVGKRLCRLKVANGVGVSLAPAVDIFRVERVNQVEEYVAWKLPWRSAMKFWAGQCSVMIPLRISDGGLIGAGSLSTHKGWFWSADLAGKHDLRVIDPVQRGLVSVKLPPVKQGNRTIFCLFVRSQRGVLYLFSAEV